MPRTLLIPAASAQLCSYWQGHRASLLAHSTPCLVLSEGGLVSCQLLPPQCVLMRVRVCGCELVRERILMCIECDPNSRTYALASLSGRVHTLSSTLAQLHTCACRSSAFKQHRYPPVLHTHHTECCTGTHTKQHQWGTDATCAPCLNSCDQGSETCPQSMNCQCNHMQGIECPLSMPISWKQN